MLEKNALIVFQKNIEKGKVKTRLAATIGDENALNVFQHLVNYTYDIVKNITVQKYLYYSQYIENQLHTPKYFNLKIQSGKNLGERMKNAFHELFKDGYQKIIIIGTDCIELDEQIINEAFNALDKNEFVLGPANDGGYYLLGMKTFHEKVFENKKWSTDQVTSDTLKDIKEMDVSCKVLQLLNDVDTEADLGDLKKLIVYPKQ